MITTLKLRRPSSPQSNYQTAILSKGEPFFDSVNNQLYVGNGVDPIRLLKPVSFNDGIAILYRATHTLQDNAHIITLSTPLTPSYTGILPVLCFFNQSFTSGQTISLVYKNGISSNELTTSEIPLKIRNGYAATSNAFVENTPGILYFNITNNPGINGTLTVPAAFIDSAVAVWQ